MSKVIEWVVPPKGADAEAQRDWQWRIAMAIIGGYALGSLIFAASIGQLWGVSGFASADDVAALQRTTKDIRLAQISNRIDTVRQRQCQAMMDGNIPAMQLAYEQLQKGIDEYHTVSRIEYRIPDCRELIPWIMQPVAAPTPSVTSK